MSTKGRSGLCLAAITGAASSAAKADDLPVWGQLALGAGVFVLSLASLAVIIACGAAIGRWRAHWTPVRADLPDGGWRLALRSRHWHVVNDVRCAVTYPSRGSREVAVRLVNFGMDEGESTIRVEYPAAFDAPSPPVPGKYRTSWTGRVPYRERRIVLARMKWQVPP